MADPAGGQELAALDTRDRRPVAGHEGEAEVGAEGLRDRAEDSPALAPGGDAVRLFLGEEPGEVVLDDEDVFVVVEQGPQLGGPRGGQAGAERILPARGQDQRLGPGGQRLLELLGPHAFVVDGDRHQDQPERAQQVEDAREARVLDGDGVAGGEVCAEDALDAVETAAEDGQGRGGDAVGGERGRGQLDQALELIVERMRPRSRVESGQGRRKVRQQFGVGVAGGQVAGAGRDHGRRADRKRRLRADMGAVAAGRADQAAAAELAVGGPDGHRADPDLRGQAADGWQLRPRRQIAVADPGLDAARQLAGGAPGDHPDRHSRLRGMARLSMAY